MKHLNLKITGTVQGVFFRSVTQKTAQELGIFGFVRNEPDGTVYIEAEGTEGALNEFLKKIKKNPRTAFVLNIRKSEGKTKNFKDFTIKY